jgi:lipopolysaccharide transport system ATP-binding protein
MTDLPKVQISGLGKAFPLRKRATFKGITTDSMAAFGYLVRQTLRPSSRPLRPDRAKGDFLFALDDVSFDVPAGEVLGIIGRNGAGKSTLLKILARVLEPTSGRVVIRGCVVSLLELGVGSAPDLTVRENIQIFGRLAGIRVADIYAAEDRILEFSRLTPFRDVPLIRCPSGSAVQLAFASMIGFNADIILADEVLTVGDADFRHACEERIRAVGQSGESVLFVSHDMNAIRRCCTRVVWLDGGRIRQIGPTEDVVRAYTSELLSGRMQPMSPDSVGAGCSIIDLRLLDAEREQIGALQITEPTYIDCVFRIETSGLRIVVHFELWQHKFHVLTATSPTAVTARQPTTFRAGIRIPADFLNDTPYTARCKLLLQNDAASSEEPVVLAEESLDVLVMNAQPERSVWTDWRWGRPGVISPRLSWSIVSDVTGAASRPVQSERE